MPHRARPMTGLLVFMGVNLLLLNTISPVYDFVCFHPYWDRRRAPSKRTRSTASQGFTRDCKMNFTKYFLTLLVYRTLDLMERV